MTQRSLIRPSSRRPADVVCGRVPLRSRELRRLARRRADRGIILVFVVVLLSLLAIMGTAYLAVSRQDRQGLTGNPVPIGYTPPMLKNRETLDKAYQGLTVKAQQQIIADLFNLQPGVLEAYESGTLPSASPMASPLVIRSAFRQQGLAYQSVAFGGTPVAPLTVATPRQFYRDIDSTGPNDVWLASLLAVNQTPIVGNDVNGNPMDPGYGSDPSGNPVVRMRWPWISAPFRGEPRDSSHGAPGDNGDVDFGASVARQLFPGVDVEPFFTDPRFLNQNTGFTLQWAGPGAGGVPLSDHFLSDRSRSDVYIRALPMTPSGSVTTTRVYPALWPAYGGYPSPGQAFISGDADGDGIADCGLMPVVLDPTAKPGVDRYVDHENNVIYLVGYRIVDNSAKVNLTTALSVQGDYSGDNIFAVKNPNNALNYLNSHSRSTDQPDNTSGKTVYNGDPEAQTDGELRNVLTLESASGIGFANLPNRGFYASNVGLLELFREQMRPFAKTRPNLPENAGYLTLPGVRSLQDFVDLRFPLASRTPYGGLNSYGIAMQQLVNGTDPITGNTGIWSAGLLTSDRDTVPNGTPTRFTFEGLGDMLQQLLVRRPATPGAALWYVASGSGAAPTLDTSAVKWLPAGDAASLSARGGSLISDQITPTLAETGLMMPLQLAAPNYNAGGQSQKWKYFTPDTLGVALWYSWTQDFEGEFDKTTYVSGSSLATPLNGIGMLDGDVNPADPGYPFQPQNDVTRILNFNTSDPGLASSKMPKSVRALVTTYSGVTQNTPRRHDVSYPNGTFVGLNPPIPLSGLPAGMPVYEVDPVFNFEVFPATRVSAATGTKEQLWRGFFSAMTHSLYRQYPEDQANPTLNNHAWTWDVDHVASPMSTSVLAQFAGDFGYDAFKPTDRHPSEVDNNGVPRKPDEFPDPMPPTSNSAPGYVHNRLSEHQVALIRSAVAACNTIDLRDADDDITAMTIDLGTNVEPSVDGTKPPASALPMYARVYGTERQLVITSVVIDKAAPTAAASLPQTSPGRLAETYVEIYNPSDRPIDLRAYRLGLVHRTNAPGTIAGGEVIPESNLQTQTIALCDPAAPAPDPAKPLNDPSNLAAARRFLQPGGFLIIYTGSSAPTAISGDVNVDVPADNPQPDPAGVTVHDRTQVLIRYDSDPDSNGQLTQPLNAALDPGNISTDELVLVRTRRADGVLTTENAASLASSVTTADTNNKTHINTPRPEYSENKGGLPATLDNSIGFLTTLVPVDAVDLRSLTFAKILTETDFTKNRSGERYVYQRQIPTQMNWRDVSGDAHAWRMFYAGNAYEFRPGTAGAYTKPDPATAPGAFWAWRDYPGLAGTGAGTSKVPANGAGNGTDPDSDKYTNRMTYVSLGAYPDANDPTVLQKPAIRQDPQAKANDYQDPGAVPALPAPTNGNRPFPAPSIPIQNFDPATNAYAGANPTPTIPIDYALTKFPYGTPFARDGDLLAVPFIGTYKIYTYQQYSWDVSQTEKLYDYVPLTMDAWALAPGDLTNGPDVENPSVGRFDARQTLTGTGAGTQVSTQVHPQATNVWADDLFDYVAARDTAAGRSFPDVPFHYTQNVGTPYNDPTVPYTDQDGPVVGADGTTARHDTSYSADVTAVSPGFRYGSDPALRTPWVDWAATPNDPTTALLANSNARRFGNSDLVPVNQTSAQVQAQVETITTDRALLPGKINVNTAPPVTQRMLPWAVNLAAAAPSTGQVLTVNADTSPDAVAQRKRAAAVETAKQQQFAANQAVVGVSSLMQLNDLPDNATYNSGFINADAAAPPTLTSDQMMYAGDLQPFYRPAAQYDFQSYTRDMTRISNLASTRSDVYTVYITVQAWTWCGTSQTEGTRLVAERRGSFIVDRSRIQVKADSAGVLSGFKPGDLVTIPVDQD